MIGDIRLWFSRPTHQIENAAYARRLEDLAREVAAARSELIRQGYGTSSDPFQSSLTLLETISARHFEEARRLKGTKAPKKDTVSDRLGRLERRLTLTGALCLLFVMGTWLFGGQAEPGRSDQTKVSSKDYVAPNLSEQEWMALSDKNFASTNDDEGTSEKADADAPTAAENGDGE